MVNGGGRTRDIKIMSLALCQLSYVTENVVDQGRLELPTSRLSAECSSQLSYRSKLNLDPSACCYAKGATAIPFTRKAILRIACYGSSQHLASTRRGRHHEHVPATFATSTTRSTLQEMAASKPTPRRIENLEAARPAQRESMWRAGRESNPRGCVLHNPSVFETAPFGLSGTYP